MKGFILNAQVFLYSNDERVLAIANEYQCPTTGIKFCRLYACKINGNTATDEDGSNFYVEDYDIKRLQEFVEFYSR